MPAVRSQQPRFIVAEISKGWIDGRPCQPTGPLCAQFEQVINTNLERGYLLRDWKLSQVTYRNSRAGEMVETIIAVFEQIP